MRKKSRVDRKGQQRGPTYFGPIPLQLLPSPLRRQPRPERSAASTRPSSPFWPPTDNTPRFDRGRRGDGWRVSLEPLSLPVESGEGGKRKGGGVRKALASIVAAAVVVAAGWVGDQQWLDRQAK